MNKCKLKIVGSCCCQLKAQTPPYYGHASTLQISGLYHIHDIDSIKMGDDHAVKWETTEKAEGTEMLCFL